MQPHDVAWWQLPAPSWWHDALHFAVLVCETGLADLLYREISVKVLNKIGLERGWAVRAPSLLVNRTEKEMECRLPKANCSFHMFGKLSIKDANEKLPTLVGSTVNNEGY